MMFGNKEDERDWHDKTVKTYDRRHMIESGEYPECLFKVKFFCCKTINVMITNMLCFLSQFTIPSSPPLQYKTKKK